MSQLLVFINPDGNGVFLSSNLLIPKLKIRQAFQVGEKLYKTREAAAKKTAWNFILTKYTHPLQQTKKVLEIECCCGDCDEETEYGIQYAHEDCPLHARKYGYFAKLHNRLASHILKEWSQADQTKAAE